MTTTSIPSHGRSKLWGLTVGGIVVGGVLWVSQSYWRPAVLSAWNGVATPASTETPHEEAHAGHDHDHAGHDELSSIELSAQARANIGLKTTKIKLSTYVRSITVPGMIVERPGRTRNRIAAPLTGIVTKIYAMPGEAVRAGQPLFDVRLTHEDMVQAQVDFLKTVEDMAVVDKEIARLRPVSENGAVPQKLMLDRQYEHQKLQGSLNAQRASLLLHGLNTKQVDEIQESRTLQSKQTVYAPTSTGDDATDKADRASEKERVFVVQAISVELGRYVNTGDLLMTLDDYSELFVEGNAFEQDGQLIAEALRDGRKITIRVQNHTPEGAIVPNLEIQYLSDQIDPVSRTLHFYLQLQNELLRDVTTNGHRYLNWRFRPGQRTELSVPVETWADRIVLPADAVVQDGVESYVFQENGDHFDRRSVQVEYRDRFFVVIAQDGSLFPGDVVAETGAQQLLIALKNKSGGAIDPHAGHNH